MRFLRDIWRASPEESLAKVNRKLAGYSRSSATILRQCKCIFVLSTGRVGTQSIAAILSLDKAYVTHHEPYPLLYGLSRLVYEVGTAPNNYAISCEAFKLSRMRLLEDATRRGRGYIESSPQATFLAEIIYEVLPRANFIHLIRNPYEVVRSGVRRNWYSGNEADQTRIVPHPGSEFALRWSEMSSFEKNIWLWKETNDWIGNFLNGVTDDRKLILRYEDCFLPHGRGLQGLFDFIDAKYPAWPKVQKILSRKLNSQKSGRFPTVEKWTPEMKQMVSDIAGGTARRFDYEILV